MTQTTLNIAQKKKDDEYYTTYGTIETELTYFLPFLKNKVIFMNCNDIDKNFWWFFYDNFRAFKLKKIIATGYERINILKPQNPVEIWTSDNGIDIEKNYLHFSNGDFRDLAMINELKKADVVITNPPYSLIRSFIQQCLDYKKDFLVLGSHFLGSYRESIKWIKNGQLKLSKNINVRSGIHRFHSSGGDLRGPATFWWTNIKIPYSVPKLELKEIYNPKIHVKYDNYNAINVKKVNQIPKNYQGLMGVPISFLHKWNAKQFEIVDLLVTPVLQGENIFKRFIIKKIDTIEKNVV